MEPGVAQVDPPVRPREPEVGRGDDVGEPRCPDAHRRQEVARRGDEVGVAEQRGRRGVDGQIEGVSVALVAAQPFGETVDASLLRLWPSRGPAWAETGLPGCDGPRRGPVGAGPRVEVAFRAGRCVRQSQVSGGVRGCEGPGGSTGNEVSPPAGCHVPAGASPLGQRVDLGPEQRP